MPVPTVAFFWALFVEGHCWFQCCDRKGVAEKRYRGLKSILLVWMELCPLFCITGSEWQPDIWLLILNKGNKQRISRFYSERFGTGLQKWMVTPNPGWLSTKRVPPSSILQKDKKGLPMKTVASFQILVYPENFTVHAFWVPQKNKKCPKKPFWIRTRTGKVMNGCSDSIGTGSALVYRMSTVGPKSV